MAKTLCSYGATFDAKDQWLTLTGTETNTGMASVGLILLLLMFGGRVCSSVWITGCKNALLMHRLSRVPIEVVNRGEGSVKTYLADVARSTYDDRLHRCKVCVVGPSEWGKTSLVQSMRTNQAFLTQLKDRTVGIDLTTCVLKSAVKDIPVRLEVTFWDFAGQDVYQAAHTLFFSKRTLFMVVVDLERYWTELQDAAGKSSHMSKAYMNRFVSAKIFRWVRSIFVHQPDAQFVVVGTKVNQLEDAQFVAEIWDDLRHRLDQWKAAFVKGLDREMLPASATSKDLKDLQGKLTNLASSEWLVANLLKVDSIVEVRDAIQSMITSSELGFPMWKTYTQVLQRVVKRREDAKNASSTRERIEKSIIECSYSNLRRQLLQGVDNLDRTSCEQIMRTLNDLGDVLWYEHDGAGELKNYIILDPMLVIDVVREVDMDVELMHAFKALLQHFQLAYPADADVMLPESDIIVPAYWNSDSSPISGAASKTKSLLPQKSICDVFSSHRWCWEYEIPSELSELIFVQFAVQSHSSHLHRTIRGFCVEVASDEFAASIALIHKNSSRDILRIEVGGVSADLGWHNMRFYLIKMEKVLEECRGDVVWRYITHRDSDSVSETRHPVGPLVKAIEDAFTRGKGAQSVRTMMP